MKILIVNGGAKQKATHLKKANEDYVHKNLKHPETQNYPDKDYIFYYLE